MADLGLSVRPCDSWSSTEVRQLTHTHMWSIRGFSVCETRYLETTVKIKESAVAASDCPSNGSSLTFRIRLHPQGNKESNKDFCFFQVFSCTNVAKFRAKFSVYNTRNEEIPATVYTGTQQLNGYFEYIRRDQLIAHIQPQDEIQLMLALTIAAETVTKNSQTAVAVIPSAPEARPAELAHDLEALSNDTKHTDFTVICRCDKDLKELRVHKAVMVARSRVFAAMLDSHTEEAQSGQVTLDVDADVMRELLFYMYSGRSPLLQLMALDLLATADRFEVIGLKEMADQTLRAGLSPDNVCGYLVLADMHSSHELRAEAIRFIVQCPSAVIETEGWLTMLKDHPRLVTEVVGMMSQEQRYCEPAPKRVRFE